MRHDGRRAYAVRAMLLLSLAAMAVLSVVAAGCGSGSTTTISRAAVSTDTTAASQESERVQLVAKEETPTDVSQSLTIKKPVVILVYVPGGTDDEAVKASLAKLAPKYPDVSFLNYNYNEPQKLGDLMQQLGSHYPPFAAFVDPSGVVQYFTTGYADEAVFNQYVVNIRQL